MALGWPIVPRCSRLRSCSLPLFYFCGASQRISVFGPDPMLYKILREVARVALHWYYRDILVQGVERIPRRGPVLVVANHPNALVDALLIGTSIPRRVLLTAKATLFDQPLGRPVFAPISQPTQRPWLNGEASENSVVKFIILRIVTCPTKWLKFIAGWCPSPIKTQRKTLAN